MESVRFAGELASVNRAEREKDATDRQLERTGQEIVFRVADSYYAVLLAKKQLEVAEQAMKTAEAILERSKNRVESGVVVESDSLSAQVRLGTRKQELIRAQNNLALARAQLSAAMGLSTQSDFEPADELTERNLPATPLEQLEKQAIEMRPDLKRIRSEESAQQESVSIAKSSFGPRVNAFADWEADNPTLVAGGGGNNWVAGIEVQIDLFEGGAKQAQLSRERAMQEKVAATREMATDAVRLEVRRAYYDVDATRQQLEVARTCHRPVARESADQSGPLRSGNFDGDRPARRGRGRAAHASRLLGNALPLLHGLRRTGTGERRAQSSVAGGDAMKRRKGAFAVSSLLIAGLSGGILGCSSDNRVRARCAGDGQRRYGDCGAKHDSSRFAGSGGDGARGAILPVGQPNDGQYRRDPRAGRRPRPERPDSRRH